MKTISVKLSAPLANWLSRRAGELGRTQSEIIREALEKERAKKTKSVGERMEELGGFYRGPKDASTNPKYLEGFGT